MEPAVKPEMEPAPAVKVWGVLPAGLPGKSLFIRICMSPRVSAFRAGKFIRGLEFRMSFQC